MAKTFKEKNTNKINRLVCLFIVAGIFLLAQSSLAASLSLSPASGSYQADKVFSVAVYVSSSDQSINAVSGSVSFPADKLEVVALTKSGTVVNLWVQEPNFSNTSGTVSFEGLVLNPGYKGSGGKVINISFRVKSGGNGTAELSFKNGSVLANDGKGTNVLSGLGKASFTLGAPKDSTVETTPPSAILPPPTEAKATGSGPKLISTTHPDQNKWFTAKKALLSWVVPAGVSSVRLKFDQSPNTTPGVVYTPAISSKELSDIADGVWYFHAQFRTSAGWGEVSHYKLQIDSQAPETFAIKLTGGAEGPQPAVSFSTTDALSGVDFYRLTVEGAQPLTIAAAEVLGRDYILPPLSPGEKTLTVEAVDLAGNMRTATLPLSIKSLASPEITNYPKELSGSQPLYASGKTVYPSSRIVISWQKSGGKEESAEVVADPAGQFIYEGKEELVSGNYQLWATVVDSRGARSTASERLNFIVKPSFFQTLSAWVRDSLSLIVPLIALLILLAMLLIYGFQHLRRLERKMKGLPQDHDQAIGVAIKMLQKDISGQVRLLDDIRAKRHLAEETELKAIKKIRSDLNEVEKIIKRRLKP